VLLRGGTPIGNLADASDRLRSALATADLIAVEDTRKLRTLASGLGVRTRGRIIVNHDHNEAERSETIVQAVQDGQRVLFEFVKRLRPMVAYTGVEALIEQINDDVVQTRAVLAEDAKNYCPPECPVQAEVK